MPGFDIIKLFFSVPA